MTTRFITHLTESGLRRLCAVAETAWFGRDVTTLSQIARLEFGPLSCFYRAICLNRDGHVEHAEAIAEELLVTGPAELQAKALLLLAGNRWQQNPGGALELYERVRRLAAEPTTALTAIKMKAVVIASLEGDHRRSLNFLESAACLLPSIPHTAPVYLDFLNAVAVEQTEMGLHDRARKLCSIATSSPWARMYPEWSQTAADERLFVRAARVGWAKEYLEEPPQLGELIAFPRPETESERVNRKRAKAIAAAGRTDQERRLDAMIAIECADDAKVQVCSKVLFGPSLTAPLRRSLSLVSESEERG